MTSKTVAQYHENRAAMQEDIDLITALCGGTRGMRMQGERYLPRRPLETKEDYDKRLQCATLYPGFTETVKTMCGRVFARPIVVNDDVPEWISKEVLPDVDMRGRNLHVFLSEWFREAFEYGVSHALVDSPAAVNVRTRADQRAAGVRPYVIRVHPWDVLGWRTDDAGRLVQLRVRYWRTKDEGEFGTSRVEQVLVYDVVNSASGVTVYERVEKGSEEWTVAVERVALPVRRIPFVSLYTRRVSDLCAEPPMRELAYLNVKHWWLQSSNDTLIDTASVPILAVSGVDSGDPITIGAKHAVRLPSGAELRYVEHTGASVSVGREALEKLKEEMRDAGAKLLQTNSMAKNVLQAGQEAARENSQLGEMVQSLTDTTADLLDLIAEWRGQESGGTIEVQADLDADLTPTESMSIVLQLREAGVLSNETTFAEAKRRGIVADDVEWDDERDRIENDLPPPPEPRQPPANEGQADG